MRLIEIEADVAEGAAWLAARDPHLAGVLERTGLPPLRRRTDGFGALLDAILSQQVSTASAAAIAARLAAAGIVSEDDVLAAGEAGLTACGLSRPKARYLTAIAAARPDYGALRQLPDEAVTARLVALPGIGAWTADIYLLMALGRADAFAPGDLALQEAARLALGLPERPKAAALAAISDRWRPWRAVAARLLWAYYRLERNREGIR